MTTPNASPESHPSKRERAKSFVKRIGRKGSQLFKRHHHSDRSPSPHRRQSPTISVLVADSTRSVLALSATPSIGRGGKSEHSRTSSAETTDSSSDLASVLDWKINGEGGLVDTGAELPTVTPSAMEQGHWLGIPGTASGEEDNARVEHAPEIAVNPSLVPPPPMSSESASDEHSSTAVSPLPVIVEPEVPDPFLIDDPEDATSEEDDSANVNASQPSLAQSSTAAEEISLAQSHSTSTSASPSPTPTSEVSNNPLPPLPPPHKTLSSPDSEDSDDEPPELYNTALTNPTMFLPIPNTDPLTTLLNKYIVPPEKRPARDLTGEWHRSEFHALVMSNSWRALARMARDRIVATNPEEVQVILPLWYLRLSCLARLRLFNQTSAECTNLFSVLNSIEPAYNRTWVFERLLPFELEVLQIRLKYWAGDSMGYLDALYALLMKCKIKSRQAKSEATISGMWKERGARVCLIIASQFLEMKDYIAATNVLEPLCKQTDGSTSPELRSAVGRIYLQAGLLDQALRQFAEVAVDPTAPARMVEMNTALMASAEGDWPKATQILERVLDDDPDNFAAINNLSVALLSQGRLKEGIEVLEKPLNESPLSVVSAEPFLFNLSTLYELRASLGAEKKRNLLIQVAKQSGDGLRTTCLKMPTN